MAWDYHTPANDPNVAPSPVSAPANPNQAPAPKENDMPDFFTKQNAIAAGAATIAIILAVSFLGKHGKLVQGAAGFGAALVALPLAAKAAA